MESLKQQMELKKQINYLQDKLNNSVHNTNGALGNDESILKASMELDRLINLYMKLITIRTHKDY